MTECKCDCDTGECQGPIGCKVIDSYNAAQARIRELESIIKAQGKEITVTRARDEALEWMLWEVQKFLAMMIDPASTIRPPLAQATEIESNLRAALSDITPRDEK